jgi:hypothetical protein
MKLAVCTPSRGTVSLGYRDNMISLARMCDERGIEFEIFDETLPNELHHARNLLLYRVATELEDDDWAWWQDSDVTLNPRLVIDSMNREEEIFARGYPIKPYGDMPPTWSVFPLMDGSKRVFWNEAKQLVRAVSHGFGAVMMRATVAKKFQKKYGVIGLGAYQGIKRSIPGFDMRINEWGILCGEDASFCDRWHEEMGGDLWIAPDGWVQNGDHGGVFLDELIQTVGLPEGVHASE